MSLHQPLAGCVTRNTASSKNLLSVLTTTRIWVAIGATVITAVVVAGCAAVACSAAVVTAVVAHATCGARATRTARAVRTARAASISSIARRSCTARAVRTASCILWRIRRCCSVAEPAVDLPEYSRYLLPVDRQCTHTHNADQHQQ